MALAQGNVNSRIRATILKPDDTAWDLSSYTVTFIFKKPLTKASFTMAASAQDAANGIMYVDTDATTLATEPGEWELQAKLDDGSGGITYTTPGVEFTVGEQI